MTIFLCASVISALVGLSVFLSFLLKGQFDDVEEAKYQIFRDEE